MPSTGEKTWSAPREPASSPMAVKMRFTSAGSHVLANPRACGKLVLPYSI